MWRSLPLAAISFILASRTVFEIPACQALATVSTIEAGFYPGSPYFANRSRWVNAMKDSGINPMSLDHMQAMTNWSRLASSRHQETLQKFTKRALDVEKAVWDAAHCQDSTWEKTTMQLNQDNAQHWITGKFIDLGRDGNLGGMGSGNLLAANFLLVQRLKQEALTREASLRPAFVKFLQNYRQTNPGLRSWLKLKLVQHAKWTYVLDQMDSVYIDSRDVHRIQTVQHAGRQRPAPTSLVQDMIYRQCFE